jgi:hypothetical protein
LSQLTKIGSRYRFTISRLRRACSQVETLFANGGLKCTNCELIYESVFLNAIAHFEALLNELMQEFVCGAPSSRVGCYALINPRSRLVFRVILTGGRAYVDLMPFKDCVEIAKRFLNEGKPFSEVDESDRNILAQAVLVRNAIAHHSKSALERFQTGVNGVDLLSPNKRFPGAYLRRVYRAHPTQTWNELYLNTLDKVGVLLASSW